MKLIGTSQPLEVKTIRKLLKPQVERRRRERINRSVERLQALLLQTKQRTEKAEILEHTVIFLKDTGNIRMDDSSEKQHFRDGFSACLQRAALFLRNDVEDRRVERALVTTFSHCLMGPISQNSVTRIAPHLPQIRSMVQSVQSCPQNFGNNHSLCCRTPLAHRDSNIAQRTNRDVPNSPASCVPTHGQAVWRPWP